MLCLRYHHENTMKKNELSKSHIILFTVTLLAVLLSFGSYVRGALRNRQIDASASANAGNRGAMGGGFNPQQMATRRLEQMTQQLQLTLEQSAKIKAIQDTQAPQLQAIRDDATLSRQQRREKMTPLRDAESAQIKQILTPEQQTKYDAMQAQRRAQFGGGNGPNRGGNAGAMGGGGRNNGGFNGGSGGVNRANSPSVTAPPPPAPRN